MLKYLKSDWGLVAICLLSMILWTYLLGEGYNWAEYTNYVALLWPIYIFISWLIYAFRRTFIFKKK